MEIEQLMEAAGTALMVDEYFLIEPFRNEFVREDGRSPERYAIGIPITLDARTGPDTVEGIMAFLLNEARRRTAEGATVWPVFVMGVMDSQEGIALGIASVHTVSEEAALEIAQRRGYTPLIGMHTGEIMPADYQAG